MFIAPTKQNSSSIFLSVSTKLHTGFTCMDNYCINSLTTMNYNDHDFANEPWRILEDFKLLYNALLKRKEQPGNKTSAISVLKRWVSDLGDQNEALLEAVNLLEKQGFHRIDLLSYLLKKRDTIKEKQASKFKKIKDANKNIEYFRQLNCEQEEVIQYLQGKQTELEEELKTCLGGVSPPHQRELLCLTDQLECSMKENQVLEKENNAMRKELKSIKSQISELKRETAKSFKQSSNTSYTSKNGNSLSLVVPDDQNSSMDVNTMKNVFHLKMLEDLKSEIIAFKQEMRSTDETKEKKDITYQETPADNNRKLPKCKNKSVRGKKAHLSSCKITRSRSLNINKSSIKEKKIIQKRIKCTRGVMTTDKLSKHLDSLERSLQNHHMEICKTRADIKKLQGFVTKIDDFIQNQERRVKELPEITKKIYCKTEKLGEKLNKSLCKKLQLETEISSAHNEIKQLEEEGKHTDEIACLSLEENYPICEDIDNVDINELAFLLSEKDELISQLANYASREPDLSKEIEDQKKLMEQAVLDEQHIHNLFEASDQQLKNMKKLSMKTKNFFSPDNCLSEDL